MLLTALLEPPELEADADGHFREKHYSFTEPSLVIRDESLETPKSV